MISHIRSTALASMFLVGCSVHAFGAEHCAIDFSKPVQIADKADPQPSHNSKIIVAEPKLPALPPPAAGPERAPQTLDQAQPEPPAEQRPARGRGEGDGKRLDEVMPPPPAYEQSEELVELPDLEMFPALKHIASTGAKLLDLGKAHGLHAVAAKIGNQFMILQIAPDGQAVVGGPMLELSKTRLTAIAGAQVSDLGEAHGMRGLFLRNGAEYQVLYEAPDHRAMIAGVMWDSVGKNLTHDQVAKIDGVLPTVVVDGTDKGLNGKAPMGGLALVSQASFGPVGRADAPELWMIFDPACTYSVQAFDALKPFVAAGQVRLNIVPISILDHEDNGMSTQAALSLLSNAPGEMAASWARRDFSGPVTGSAEAQLSRNGQIAEAVKLTGTPTFFYRKADGSEGRVDGMPTNVRALLGDLSGKI